MSHESKAYILPLEPGAAFGFFNPRTLILLRAHPSWDYNIDILYIPLLFTFLTFLFASSIYYNQNE